MVVLLRHLARGPYLICTMSFDLPPFGASSLLAWVAVLELSLTFGGCWERLCNPCVSQGRSSHLLQLHHISLRVCIIEIHGHMGFLTLAFYTSPNLPASAPSSGGKWIWITASHMAAAKNCADTSGDKNLRVVLTRIRLDVQDFVDSIQEPRFLIFSRSVAVGGRTDVSPPPM